MSASHRVKEIESQKDEEKCTTERDRERKIEKEDRKTISLFKIETMKIEICRKADKTRFCSNIDSKSLNYPSQSPISTTLPNAKIIPYQIHEIIKFCNSMMFIF